MRSTPRLPHPVAGNAARWRADAQHFEFALKLFQKFTHPDMFHKATGADPLDLDKKDVDEFRAAIDPLASAGKLGALLAQFPASFKNEPNTRGYVEWLLKQFREYDVAVELRHKSWSDTAEETLELLSEFGAAWTQIDEPKFKLSIRQNLRPDAKTFYYLRLHGRNAAQWWSHEKSEDRYNYRIRRVSGPFAEAVRDATRREVKRYLKPTIISAKSVAMPRSEASIGRMSRRYPRNDRALPGLKDREDPPLSFTEALLRMSPRCRRSATAMPGMTAEDGVFESSSGAFARGDVEWLSAARGSRAHTPSPPPRESASLPGDSETPMACQTRRPTTP